MVAQFDEKVAAVFVKYKLQRAVQGLVIKSYESDRENQP